MTNWTLHNIERQAESDAQTTNFMISHIKRHGPISVAEYMSLALNHPVFGYYQTQEPLGVKGDFTTAPEISQLFGELVGIWCLKSWESLGEPGRFCLVELGPGHGTLMSDLLRVAKLRPAFIEAADIHLIDASPFLRRKQSKTLRGVANITWHDNLSKLPKHPLILVANEFFDCLPVRQMCRTDGGWRERGVHTDQNGDLDFVFLRVPAQGMRMLDKFEKSASTGDIIEVSPERYNLMHKLAKMISVQSGCGLFVDYGHTSTGFGDTLQAVQNHGYADVLSQPGKIDITAHVDFEVLADAAKEGGAKVYGPIPQSLFLKQMGIENRAQKLMDNTKPQQTNSVQAGLERLIAGNQMGSLFKVMAISGKGNRPIAGFLKSKV